MSKSIFLLIALLYFGVAHAQTDSTLLVDIDTIETFSLQEIVIIAERSILDKNAKALSTLDSYLENASSVNMIRRGPYAWEPFLNGMASERSVVTVDGMRIYAACTDKMDPVTSYVEITNLSQANIHSGQSGSASGATIAGSVDLQRQKSDFGEKANTGLLFTGFETNNGQKIVGTSLSAIRPRFFSDLNLTYRDAENYKAGGGEEIQFSPFTKFNMSAIAGIKVDDHRHIEASLIYDKATDVGYPALPMDVSLAKALIGSIEYIGHHSGHRIDQWQIKLYYNDVRHVMDDSKRPVVPIRMDMPGWSKTAGINSSIQGTGTKHFWKANVSSHRNESLAEMTMYSNNPNEKEMFMLTWPGVYTNYVDVFGEYNYTLSRKWQGRFTGGLAVHNNQVRNQFGLESLQIFYPNMQSGKTRFLKRFGSSFQYKVNDWESVMGVGYGERAPGVSEGYGFYLFNSFDRFDYIGNPDLTNERSVDLNVSVSHRTSRFSEKLSISFFHITDYIIGSPADNLDVMTVGAVGVKVYDQLDYANIFNSSLESNYRMGSRWNLTSKLAYRRGIGADVGNLPLIQPFTYFAGLSYSVKSFTSEANIAGATRQNKFGRHFGETSASPNTIINLSASQRFKLLNQSLVVKVGVENLLDTYYTTFADWNRVPRMGRNIFMNAILIF